MTYELPPPAPDRYFPPNRTGGGISGLEALIWASVWATAFGLVLFIFLISERPLQRSAFRNCVQGVSYIENRHNRVLVLQVDKRGLPVSCSSSGWLGADEE